MVLSVYNYKGGVMKTTVSINLAASLVNSGCRVLLVDADPQCSLTTFFFPDSSDAGDDVSPEEDVRSAGDDVSADTNDEPAIVRYPINPKVQPADLVAYYDGERSNNLRMMVMELQEYAGRMLPDPCVIPGYNDNLLLVPGSHKITQLCEELGDIKGGRVRPDLLRFPSRTNSYVGAFRKMINMLISKWQLDYVLVDCASANSPLNKMIAMTSDYILPPVFPDFFSAHSVQGLLTDVLPGWYSWRQEIVEYQSQAGALGGMSVDFKLDVIARQVPRILPFLVLNLDLHSRDAKSVSHAKSKWVRCLETLVSDPIVVPAIVRDHFRPNRGAMVIPFLRNVRSVLDRSHVFVTPMINVDVGWCGTSSWDLERLRQQDMIDDANTHFSSLVAFLEYVRTHG